MAVDGYPTPEDAARHGMPAGITHVVGTRMKTTGDAAYVLLAVEANPPGFYLDENLVHRDDDGSWQPGGGAGGGFTARTLAALRANPPPQGVYDGDRAEWPD